MKALREQQEFFLLFEVIWTTQDGARQIVMASVCSTEAGTFYEGRGELRLARTDFLLLLRSSPAH
jgi:hypothetical protein